VDDACSSGRGRLMRRKRSEQSWPRPATAGTRAGRSCEMWAAACCGQRRSTQAAAAAPSAGRRRRQLQPVRGAMVAATGTGGVVSRDPSRLVVVLVVIGLMVLPVHNGTCARLVLVVRCRGPMGAGCLELPRKMQLCSR
jgi:hypothetical protein